MMGARRASLLGAFALGLILAGCGADGPPEAPSQADTASMAVIWAE
jgi:predicted small lipoprotein YifL